MLFLFLLRISFSYRFHNFAGIDLGSQFTKIAISSRLSEPKIFLNNLNKNLIPTAFAIKPTSKSLNFSIKSISNFSYKFGENALQILKKNPSYGDQFIPASIGMINSSFHQSQFMSTADELTIFLSEIYNSLSGNPQIMISVPGYWTKAQREILMEISESLRIPIKSIIDSSAALVSYYSVRKFNKYKLKNKIVIFIDIGAIKTSVSGYNFGWNSEFSMVNETRTEWSESIGGYWFAKALGLNLKKSLKVLNQEGGPIFLSKISNQIDELKKMISSVIQSSESQYENSDIEIQLIGGASKFKFIKEFLKSSFNNIQIFSELTANEAIALGSLYHLHQFQKRTDYSPILLQALSPYSYSLKCGSTNPVCDANGKCNETLLENESLGCEYADFIANESQLRMRFHLSFPVTN